MAVDVQSLTQDYGQEVRRVRTEVLLRFRDRIQQELTEHPEHREQVLAELRHYRDQFRDSGEAHMEDIVLDVMDMVTGWAAQDARV
jgi:hypothetical protein